MMHGVESESLESSLLTVNQPALRAGLLFSLYLKFPHLKSRIINNRSS